MDMRLMESKSTGIKIVKRSHSLDFQNDGQYSVIGNNKSQLQLNDLNGVDSQSVTTISRVVTTWSTPKRHHPASPVMSYAADETKSNNVVGAKSEVPFITNLTPCMSLDCVKQEKYTPRDSETIPSTPSLEEKGPINLSVSSYPLQQNTDDITIPTISIGSKITACSSNIGRINGPLIPKLCSMGSNNFVSLRNKAVSRSKRHSSRTNLYIRGLPKSMSENDLVSLVPDASMIRSVKLVVNNDGEGYGFIDFISNETALIAMQHIKLQNSSQYVNFAYESEKDPLNVYVTNIPESWNSENVEKLKQIFSPFGKITSALVMTRRSTNTCTGTGFVRFLTSEEAQRAIDGIRKAKITLPGAKRPIELKLADRQRARESKSGSHESETNTLPLLQQFIRDDTHHHLCQAIKPPRVEDIFNVTAIPESNMFDQTKTVNYASSGTALVSPSSTDITTTSSDEIPALPQLTNPAFMPVPPAVAAATAAVLARPLFQLPCIPWVPQDFLSTQENPAAAYMHPQIAATVAQKAATTAATIDLNSFVTAYQMAYLGALNCGVTAPAQHFDLIFPFTNGPPNGHLVDDTNLYPYGLNQSLWSKASFYG